MDQPNDLLSIGAFARMTRLSIKALRLYDQLGLLQPQHVDGQTGYRFYGVDQLSSARMIRNMREMDMPLATIRQVLAALAAPTSSPAQAEALARDYVEMRERQIEQIRAQVQQFIQRIQMENNPTTLEVNIKQIAPQQVLSSTHHIKVGKLDTTIRTSLDAMYALLKEQHLEAAAAPFGIFHGPINERTDDQHTKKFGMSSINNISDSQKSQNPITFTCRLSISDKKRKSRHNA